MASADSPLYLASIIKPSSHIWFKKQPLEKNSLGPFMKSMSEAAGLSGKHTNHSVHRTMISTLSKRKRGAFKYHCTCWSEKLEVFGQLFQYVHQAAKDMSLKLSCYVEGEERHKSVAKSQVLMPKQRDENGGNNLFSGAVFNNCNFTFTPGEAGFSCDNAAPPVKKFKRILPLIDSDDEL